MIQESYVSFDIAILLKEKGFDEEIETLITPKGTIFYLDENSISKERHQKIKNSKINIYSNDVSCPTQAMAMAWLREEKGLHISCCIQEDTAEDADGNTVDIWTYWEWGVIRCCDGIIIETSSIDEQYQTYEEAVEAALKYSLAR